MSGNSAKEREAIRPEFDRSIMIDFRGAKVTWYRRFSLVAGDRRAIRHLGSYRG